MQRLLAQTTGLINLVQEMTMGRFYVTYFISFSIAFSINIILNNVAYMYLSLRLSKCSKLIHRSLWL
jgi:hypothetical protein